MSLKRFFRSRGILSLALTLAVLAGSLFEISLFVVPEGRLLELAGRLRPAAQETPVVLVAIDEQSLADLGDWPWPRGEVAGLIEGLSQGGARAIGLCLPLPEPERSPGLEALSELRRQFAEEPSLRGTSALGIVDGALARAARGLDGDVRLAGALEKAANVILPLRIEPAEAGEPPAEVSSEVARNLSPLERPTLDWRQALLKFQNPLTALDPLPAAAGVTPPLSGLTAKARGLGHFGYRAEPGGGVLAEPLLVRTAEGALPSLSLRTALLFTGTSPSRLAFRDGEEGFTGLVVKGLKIPTDRRMEMLIDFDRHESSFERYSFSRVAAGEAPADAFRGKAVLVGVTAPGLAPVHPTPLGPKTPEAEIAAQSLADILGQSHLSRPGWAPLLEGVVILYFGFFLLLVVPRVQPRVAVLILGVFLLSWYGVAAALLATQGWWFHLLPPTLLTLLGLLIHLLFRYTGGRQQESAELNKMLGLSFQSQGMLDLALDKFMQCPVEDLSVREHLYNLALDFERKRMFSKALSVYTHIRKAGRFKDVTARVERLKTEGGAMLFSSGASSRRDATVMLENAVTRPTLGRYEIVRELGQGAMGTVYLGRDPKINREVAIKTLHYQGVEEDQLAEVKKRFFREAEAAGRLNHPNIVTIYDAGEEHDMAFLAMELLSGQDLSAFARKGALLPVATVLEILASVAEALDYAHKNGVVHRDIKPANIMRLDDGQVKVADFGIARVMAASQTQTGVVLGTPNYMSPEQVAGKKVDGRSDLFSLGAVMYELLSGEKPFKGESLASLMFNIANASYDPLSMGRRKAPKCCLEILDKLLAKSPGRRFKTAGEAAEMLRKCLKKVG